MTTILLAAPLDWRKHPKRFCTILPHLCRGPMHQNRNAPPGILSNSPDWLAVQPVAAHTERCSLQYPNFRLLRVAPLRGALVFSLEQ